ncbi:MAG: hypothetical protein O7G85_06710 [Planctomycetota bacterium]|nr:hypothetical protein [Planctomycetota bacterium]
MSRRSFTLLEVLIAIALTLALLGTMFGFLINLLEARAQVIEISGRQRAANVLIERLERDLMACLGGDSTMGAGVEGETDRLSVLSRGLLINEQDASGSFADVQRSEYQFDESRATLQARRYDASSSDDRESEFETIGENIFKVRFRYYDGRAWSESFNSLDAKQLPVAIEMAFWFDPWPGETMPDRQVEDSFEFEPEASGFDEMESARLSDLKREGEPQPDRRRVIVIPDAQGAVAP